MTTSKRTASRNRAIVRQDPPRPKEVVGRGRPETEQTREALAIVTGTPNVWFRVDERAFVSSRSQSATLSYGYHLRKKAAARGHTLEVTTRRVGPVVRLYARSVVEAASS